MSDYANTESTNNSLKIANFNDMSPGSPLLIVDPPWYSMIFDWKFWLIIIICVLVILSILYGGKTHEFVGMNPLKSDGSPDKHISDDIDEFTLANIKKGEMEAMRRELINSNNSNNSNDNDVIDMIQGVTFIDDSINNSTDSYNYSSTNYSSTNYPSTNYSTKNPSDNQPWGLIPNAEPNPIPTFNILSKEKGRKGRTPKKIKIPNLPKNRAEHTIAQIPIVDPDGSQSQVTASINTKAEFKPRIHNRSRGEQICIDVMENRYGVPFGTYRPNFLVNPKTGQNLELDCYNPNLKITIEHDGYEFIFNGIAVEYNGIQHYIWPNFTGQSKENFIYQREKDDFKRKKCDEHGIYLLVVPYNVPEDMIKDYIHYYLPENVLSRGEFELPN